MKEEKAKKKKLSKEFKTYIERINIHNKKLEKPTIEIVELVCQNTPDWTHGTRQI